MKNSKLLMAAMISALSISFGMTAYAGDINENEAGIVSAAQATFTYNGKSYVADPSYLAQLQAKLQEDDVDLTPEQAAEVIATMNGSVKTGVTNGYLIEIGGEGTAEEETTETTESSDGENGKEDDTTEQDSVNESEGDNPIEVQENKEQYNIQNDKIEDLIENDNRANDYKGFNIKEIYGKEVKERTEEEEQVFQTYLEEQAINRLFENSTQKDKTKNLKGPLVYGGVVIFLLVAGYVIFYAITKKRKITATVQLLPETYIDIHSHILPGVDDGSDGMETTLTMVDKAYQQGVRIMIATPHYRIGHRHRTVEELQRIYNQTCEKIAEKYTDFKLYLGNEIFYSDGVEEKILQGRALTLGGTRYILVEFRTDESYSRIRQALIILAREGYVPILAHGERYRNLMEKESRVKELKQMGVLLQINADSIKKHKRLVRKGYVDFLATDCHNLKERAPNMEYGVRALCAVAEKEQIEYILKNMPSVIMKDAGK